MASLHVFFLVLACLLVPSLSTQLYSFDLQVLKNIKGSLHDLPGSEFFSSWNFDHDPCRSFHGVVCAFVDGALRVRELNLGSGLPDSPGLTGELHPSIGNLGALRQLTVSPGEVGGQIPESFGDLLDLEFLGISKNWLSGSMPQSLQDLENLHTLDLSFNQLNGAIPRGIGQLPRLKALILGHNNLVGSIPPFSAPIAHLDLRENMFSGSLPPLPKSLGYICLSKNQLSGQLDRVSVLPKLWYLDLSFNQFSGNLPASILDLKLSSLFLQRNRLSGEILPSGLVKIGKIDLSQNAFTGRLSPYLASTSSLYLSNNLLSETVPEEFFHNLQAGSMEELYLQHNFFTDMTLDERRSIPTTSVVCVEYNCFLPPMMLTCAKSAGEGEARPEHECGH